MAFEAAMTYLVAVSVPVWLVVEALLCAADRGRDERALPGPVRASMAAVPPAAAAAPPPRGRANEPAAAAGDHARIA